MMGLGRSRIETADSMMKDEDAPPLDDILRHADVSLPLRELG
jgi:hypothetical protein